MSAESRAARTCLAAALALTLAWGLTYLFFAHGDLCDESGHLGVMYHFAEKKPGWPDQLTTLPGYQLLTVWLSGGHPSYTWARAVSLGFALLGVAAFAGAWKKLHGRPATTAVLLFALLPIAQPYGGMAYNDVPALAMFRGNACSAPRSSRSRCWCGRPTSFGPRFSSRMKRGSCSAPRASAMKIRLPPPRSGAALADSRS